MLRTVSCYSNRYKYRRSRRFNLYISAIKYSLPYCYTIKPGDIARQTLPSRIFLTWLVSLRGLSILSTAFQSLTNIKYSSVLRLERSMLSFNSMGMCIFPFSSPNLSQNNYKYAARSFYIQSINSLLKSLEILVAERLILSLCACSLKGVLLLGRLSWLLPVLGEQRFT